MKALHILDHSLPLHSGYTFRSQNIFKQLIKFGYNISVVTSPKHQENVEEIKFKEEEIIGGIKYYRSRLKIKKFYPVIYEVILMKQLFKKIMAVSKKEKPDIIHAHSPVLNCIPALIAGKVLNIPVVYEIRAFWEDAAVDHGTYKENSIKYKIVRMLETFVSKKSAHLFTICNGLKNDLVKRGISSDKVSIVYNGINVSDFENKSFDEELCKKWNLKNKTIIGFIGSFYKYEGLDLLVKAFADISKEYDNVALLLVGGGEMKDNLQMLIKDLNIENKVIMPGRIPHEKISGVYGMVDILAYPRYPMRLTELVTPLKPLEAMAMKKVFIASDVGGHKELIKDNVTGVLFKAGNIEDLKEKLKKLIYDKSLRDQIAVNGNLWVKENHKWEKTLFSYNKIYSKLICKS